MQPSRTRPELLAPAGDWEALRAAVANGADAVYFGLSNFNARARAANFTPDELPDVMRFLHARNVRGFVTLNTLIFSDELPAVAEFVQALSPSAGVDAVIVQDLGLVRLIQPHRPDAARPRLHADDAHRAAAASSSSANSASSAWCWPASCRSTTSAR